MGGGPHNSNKKKKSTDCGYDIEHEGDGESGIITILPTKNQGSCGVKLSIGNAVFKIDPANAPEELKAVVDGDANGEYAPHTDITRGARTSVVFSNAEVKSNTFEDSDGNEVTMNYISTDEIIENDKDTDGFSILTREIDVHGQFSRIIW